ncbi:hypothetical protein PEC301899_38420 [Pectobacterium carotovorum subsp. carotovorum]|nr:hypothetical protein PEC301899_38420 [Pectobacterium carotovorum subsp. carotovorum]
MGFLRYFTLADRNQRFLTFSRGFKNMTPRLKQGAESVLGFTCVYLVEVNDRIFGEHVAIDIKLEIIRCGAK